MGYWLQRGSSLAEPTPVHTVSTQLMVVGVSCTATASSAIMKVERAKPATVAAIRKRRILTSPSPSPLTARQAPSGSHGFRPMAGLGPLSGMGHEKNVSAAGGFSAERARGGGAQGQGHRQAVRPGRQPSGDDAVRRPGPWRADHL